MSLPIEFWDSLPRKSDAELYDLLGHADDYLPEAIAAAKDELRKRNLTPERIGQFESAFQSQKLKEAAKAQEPLNFGVRLFIFLFCSGLFGVLLACYYDNQGYKRKARDCWITLACSILIYLFLAVMATVGR